MSESASKALTYRKITRACCYAALAGSVVAILVAFNLEHGTKEQLKTAFYYCIGLTLPATIPLLFCFFLWQKHVKLLSYEYLPNHLTKELDAGTSYAIRTSWLIRRMHNLKQMRALWRLWVSGAQTSWFRNPATIWQIVFVFWLSATRNTEKALRLVDNDKHQLGIGLVYNQILLGIVLIFLTLKITQGIHAKLQERIPALNAELTLTPKPTKPATTKAAAPTKPAPQQQQAAVIQRKGMPKDNQDPIIWRRR